MKLQYISNSKGKTTGVYIPIEEWNELKEKFSGIDQEEIEILEWQKQEVLKRLRDYESTPEQSIRFEDALDDIENEF